MIIIVTSMFEILLIFHPRKTKVMSMFNNKGFWQNIIRGSKNKKKTLTNNLLKNLIKKHLLKKIKILRILVILNKKNLNLAEDIKVKVNIIF